MPPWADILVIGSAAIALLAVGFTLGVIFAERHIDSVLPAALARMGLRVKSDE